MALKVLPALCHSTPPMAKSLASHMISNSLFQSSVMPMILPCDECLKHSSYTRVGSPFSRLFYRNFIVFVVRSLIFVSGVVAGTVE